MPTAAEDKAKLDQALSDVVAEMRRGTARFGPFASDEEGLHVLLEELGETARARLEGRPQEEVREEWVQVAAMAIRYLMDRF